MSATHTPGPWFLPAENAGSVGTSVWARGGDVRVADCNSAAISLPGRQADARLISAAPDLLEVLQFCVQYDGGECLGDHQHRLAQARAAIAKATGDAA